MEVSKDSNNILMIIKLIHRALFNKVTKCLAKRKNWWLKEQQYINKVVQKIKYSTFQLFSNAL